MCASKNITVKIKSRQQKLSQQNYSLFQMTILESYKSLLKSCSHVPTDLEKSSLDILQIFSFSLPQKKKKPWNYIWASKWQKLCFWVNYSM